ncbi:juvenile hormone esterase-like [Pieris brassicae]|uniref:juvenile hormone esterase-like n=1 Tax=Pieris brassicae TaxID=7116 RepID=UPI001E6607D4|nr:juvenile hormone esterase-like [Pieris brassicae]
MCALYTKGLLKTSLYYSFEGIPYAESVSGEFRFMPPIPKEPWPYILDATQDGPVCPQLNAFGFLSVNEEYACGNAGIKDVLLSLKWINKNLKYFGGDSRKITIGGHSSGGTLAHYLMLSKKTSGLFQ